MRNSLILRSFFFDENTNLMELIEIKVSRYPKTILGIKIYETEELLYIIHNPVDYVLDGMLVINKRFLKYTLKEEETNLRYRILQQKVKTLLPSTELYADSMKNLATICEKNKILVEIGLDNQTYVWIGHIESVEDKGFTFKTIDTQACFYTEEKVLYNRIRILYIGTDYLNSLGLVI